MTSPLDEDVRLEFVDSPDDLVTVDLAAVGTAIHARLKDSVVGYVLQIRKQGSLVHTAVWGSVQTTADESIGWNEDVRMHVASVSKFLTGVALVKALTSKGVSYDAKISDYLPAHWNKGDNIDRITFRDVMTHRSGLTGLSYYSSMKAAIAAGVGKRVFYDYQNVNFGLCRILIPLINGSWERGRVFSRDPADNDQAWSLATLNYYQRYMQGRVFAPAGVKHADLARSTDRPYALAYPFPAQGENGWDKGDSATYSGGVGWRLSTREMLDVMNTVRREDSIISSEDVQYMLDHSFGVDEHGTFDSPAGRVFSKSGAIGDDQRLQQCVVCFLPRDMELALFVNSPIGAHWPPRITPRAVVRQAFLESLSDPI